MTLCGQTKLHCPHWTQRSSRQTGTVSERLRFSNAAVPDGNVPSTGMALTGIWSPSPAKIRAVTVADEIRRIRRHQGRHVDPAGDVRRNFDFAQPRQGSVDRGEVLIDDRLPLARVCLADRLLDVADRLLARQNAGDGEEAGLQNGVGPRTQADLARDGGGVDDEQAQFLVDDRLLHRPRQSIPDSRRPDRAHSAAPWRRGRRRAANPAAAAPRTDGTPTNPAWAIRYGASIGSGPKRRCEIVCAPDLCES